MAETKNNGTQAESNEKTTATITAKVLKVTTFNDDPKRITITLDGNSFVSIDANENTIETNSFGIATRLAVDETAQKVPELQLANALAMGKTINPQIVALCLTGATLTIERELKRKGEPTRAAELGAKEGEVYAKDTWVTSIKDVRPNISALFQPYIMELIKTSLCVKETKRVLNPFEALAE